MTVLGLLAAVRRWWLMVLLGGLLTASAAFVVAGVPGVYWAQVNVVFLAPPSPDLPNPLGYSSDRLVDVASLVEREVIGPDPQPHVVSPAVSIVDEGVRSGERVRLPNQGGQWTYNFEKPQLDVQVVDSTPEAARARMDRLLAQIEQTLDRRQDEAGVNEGSRVRTALSPPRVEIHYAAGLRPRALLVTLVVGTVLTLAAVDRWDRGRPSWVTRRRTRKQRTA